jgi:pyruvate dehydrogenase (quinone)
MSKTVAALLVETLAQAGIKRIYGVAGDSLNGITDAIRQRGDVQWALVRHEETAAPRGARRQGSRQSTRGSS